MIHAGFWEGPDFSRAAKSLEF